jgi:hypothetical protein
MVKILKPSNSTASASVIIDEIKLSPVPRRCIKRVDFLSQRRI